MTSSPQYYAAQRDPYGLHMSCHIPAVFAPFSAFDKAAIKGDVGVILGLISQLQRKSQEERAASGCLRADDRFGTLGHFCC